MSDDQPKGTLYLVPSLIADIPPLEVLPLAVKKVIDMTEHYIAENEKTARHFIKKILPNKDQSSLHISTLNKYTDQEELDSLLDPCLQGYPLGLLSEAGAPGVADPGAEVVIRAHRKKLRIVPLAGPSSILMSIMASGMNGQNFAFVGYLPVDRAERRQRIRELERHSRKTGQTQAFIETPYRNGKLFEDLLQFLSPETRLCLAISISSPQEFIRTTTVQDWKNMGGVDMHKKPAMFLIDARPPEDI